MPVHNGRMYLVVVDDTPDSHARSSPADSALDAARHVADALGFGETLHEGATALGRWTIATADEHRVSAWLAPWDPDAEKLADELDASERNVLCAVDHGPIMEADIGPAELQVRALVSKRLLQWKPEGAVRTPLGDKVRAALKSVTP